MKIYEALHDRLLDRREAAVKLLIGALKQRVSFHSLRDNLKKNEFPTGIGWDDIHAHSMDGTEVGEKFRNFLVETYSQSLVAGNRYVWLYDLDRELTSALVTRLTETKVNGSYFESSYPLPLPVEGLVKAPGDPELCEIRHHKSGDVSLVFCQARFYDDKTSYAAKELPEHVRKTYHDVDRVVTYRKIFYQAYDVITIRANLNRLEVCVDDPAKLTSTDLETQPLKLLTAAALHLEMLTGTGGRPPLNLFGAIAAMYYEGREGTVTSLSFRTITGSIKKERMTAASQDLRDEKFHHAGVNALGQKISPYELTLEYETKIPLGAAQLKLSAMIKELAAENPTLHGCFVSSLSFECFTNALNRMVTFIPDEK
ncbi:hypothetical protein [Herbaspirillum rubrisubalbicans]|uniref:hypothetical protein n=1 Tax=Herbaspirillum rubrisubalbicans TaxID=80842 RepID=UPI0015C52622|nr:hypothetical protein [Herbaspirillum rubrisubalbicans]NQE51898.1 hypothetical protein [Herbaspirillum rubrisubalbicans]